jgi:molybdopterin-containing oxidoreductase family iron-sulfur binding subunit
MSSGETQPQALSMEAREEATLAQLSESILHPRSAPRYWRSLDELEQTPEFLQQLAKEFPDRAGELENGETRRTFLKYMAASLALAGLTSCTKRPEGKIIPYVRQPEEIIPGKPLFFATACTFGGYARGILVESHEGRPTKIEGNPDHPASLGSTDAVGQAHVLDLYDPDRSQTVTHTGEVSSWSELAAAITGEFIARKQSGGQGIRILSPTVTSPTFASQMSALQKAYPKLRWHSYDPLGTENVAEGSRFAFGKDAAVEPVYHFDAARIIVSLDDNFLQDHPGSLAYARQFASARRVRQQQLQMNRLYVAESAPTITGAMADARLRVLPSEVDEVARFVAAGVGIGSAGKAEDAFAGWINAVITDLKKYPGQSLVIAGQSQPPAVQALAFAINAKLGNIGKTITFIDAVPANVSGKAESLEQLCADLDAGTVDLLIMLGGNPVYDAPVDLDFVNRLQKARLRVHHAQYEDETSFYCHWHAPLAHELEAWSDARSFDGTATIMQPLIAPLYQGRSVHELLSILLGQPDRSGYEIVRDYWRAQHQRDDFEQAWVKWLNDGLVANSAAQPKTLTLTLDASALPAPMLKPGGEGTEIAFRPDPQVRDGRYANNGWLQEIPRPLTRLSWDNAILMSPETASKHLFKPQQDYRSRAGTPIVELRYQDRTIRGPLWILPGMADDFVTVYLGFGRTRAGRVGNGAGFNAYAVRTADRPWMGGGVQLKSTGESMDLACVQNHQMMEQHDRDLVHVIPIQEKHDTSSHAGKTHSLSLYPGWTYPSTPAEGNKWGMVIDLNSCIGCNACVAACQSENNIAVVGKDQVMRGREMHWLRIDNYYAGESAADADGPFFQPVPCMHCENAPCELVCPVGATVHDAEGTNNMVYNRCIGTRYCSNNCPYKVRHFNFLQFSDQTTESLKLGRNPNVTVRSRGVMEKCTYCVQRINAARIDAKKEDRAIRDGEVVPACAQSCPTQAIVFGNLNDAGAAVTKLRAEPENYSLLDEELQTRPRTTYLPRYVNPDEEMSSQ